MSLMRSRRFRWNAEGRDRNIAIDPSHRDGGFTLVELLVVLVILPLIIGAIAAAIIVSEDNATTTRASVEASTSAQDTSLYFVRDVQAAEFVTTTNVPGPFSTQSPQVCPSGNPLGARLTLALYRPATAANPAPSNALSVAYWVTGGSTPELVRDECTVNADGTVAPSSEEVLSDTIASGPVVATIAFAPPTDPPPATTAWVPTSSGAATVSSINMSITQSGDYTYGFSATPRQWSSQNAGVPTEAGPP